MHEIYMSPVLFTAPGIIFFVFSFVYMAMQIIIIIIKNESFKTK